MCHKIRCDEESWKLFGFQGELNKAWRTAASPVEIWATNFLSLIS